MLYKECLYKQRKENTVYDASNDAAYKPNFNSADSLKWGIGGGIMAAITAALASRKNKLRNGILAGIAGFGAGWGGKSVYDMLQGPAYNTASYKIPTSKDVYIGVSGAGEGMGSGMQRNMAARFGEGNVAMFRWCDREALRKYMADASKAGKRIHLYGHSYGGATAAQEARNSKLPIAELNTYDPVSWTDRVTTKPTNVISWNNYTPGNTSMKDADNIIAAIGGQWGDSVPDTKSLPTGNHGNTAAWLL